MCGNRGASFRASSERQRLAEVDAFIVATCPPGVVGGNGLHPKLPALVLMTLGDHAPSFVSKCCRVAVTKTEKHSLHCRAHGSCEASAWSVGSESSGQYRGLGWVGGEIAVVDSVCPRWISAYLLCKMVGNAEEGKQMGQPFPSGDRVAVCKYDALSAVHRGHHVSCIVVVDTDGCDQDPASRPCPLL